MSLVVWLPMNRDLRNQGLSNVTVTNNGATFNSAGKLGGCYYFNGDKQWLQFDSVLGDYYNNDWSIACWMKPTDSTRTVIISEYSASGASNVGLELTTSRIVRLYWNGNPDINFYTAGALPLNEWTHLVVTKAGREVRVYFNGELKQTYTNSSDFSTRTSAAQPRIGDDYRGNSANTVSYQGYMNDFRMYDHCLSPMEVKELSKGLVLHYPLNRGGWGQENLLSRYVVPGHAAPTSTAAGGRTTWLGDYKITIPATENADTYFRLFTTKQLTTNATYTISCQVDGLLDGTYYRFPLYAQGNTAMGVLNLDHNGLCSLTFTMTYGTQTAATGANGETVYICFMDDSTRAIASGQGAITVSNFKLEEGSIATPWCPNSSDALATTMGLNGTTEYDCSGYCNNGSKNNITYISDTPKYTVSSIFNGSNSYIKVNDNNWMVKGMSEMTVNLWAKATTWPTNGGRLLSCTETGGFNLEAGSSGYWRFPIYVYTNSEQTSSAYKYDSNEIKIADLIPGDWNMITLVYDSTGTKTYLNGELHHTYTNTSYGINFNTGARLFLGCEANLASPSSPYFNGKECDFRIYATALSADDVKSLYQNCATIDADGTIHGQIRS